MLDSLLTHRIKDLSGTFVVSDKTHTDPNSLHSPIAAPVIDVGFIGERIIISSRN
jgi:hypothetical protein